MVSIRTKRSGGLAGGLGGCGSPRHIGIRSKWSGGQGPAEWAARAPATEAAEAAEAAGETMVSAAAERSRGQNVCIGASNRGTRVADGYCLLHLKVVPRASRARIVGWRPDGRLGIRVTAPPEGGRANGAALELLARALGVPRRSLELMSGANARLKTVRVSGLTEVEVRSRLSHDSQEAAL